MKTLIVIFSFLLFLSDKPDNGKLYVTMDIHGMVEIYKFYANDSVRHMNSKKIDNYDFYEKKNLEWCLDHLDNSVDAEKYKYTHKGDSIFIDRSDGLMLIILSKGIFKTGKMVLNTTYSMVNGKGRLEVIKTIPNQVFTPY
jgi:hypothetical protein